MKRLGIVWFRNDLRLHDNEVGFIVLCLYRLKTNCFISQILVWAHTNNDYVIHMYCFDPRQITNKTYKCDFVKCEKYRLKFLIETVENLSISLINKGRCEVIFYLLIFNSIL